MCVESSARTLTYNSLNGSEPYRISKANSRNLTGATRVSPGDDFQSSAYHQALNATALHAVELQEIDVMVLGTPVHTFNKHLATSHLEMTIRIDDHAHPLLYAYLHLRRQGKPRAAALKRLAENALLPAESSTAKMPAMVVTENGRSHDIRDEQVEVGTPTQSPGVNPSDVLSSLSQFTIKDRG
jgi:hypothetical protein